MKIKNNFKATSIIESMVIMLILISGITGMYHIYSNSIKLSNSITNKIQAIQIAKQGIEAMTNIRDTNWILFSSDYNSCWNVLNYEKLCIGNTADTYGVEDNESYTIYLNSDNAWVLDKKTSATFGNGSYNDDFKVGLDNGIYTQSGITEDMKILFTRELKVNYIGPSFDETDPKMEITSLVQWVDNSANIIHEIEMKQILSNWKK